MMTPEEWARLEPLVDAALELALERRLAYIDEVSSRDPMLGAALARLVAMAERGDSLLDAAAAERATLLAEEDAGPAVDVPTQLQASLGSAYTIEREIGGGGMSRVFIAREHDLGRAVVIKVLPAERGADVSAERFAREIKLAAALQQANIVPLLSAGTAAGMPYYTMPLVEGRALRDRLLRDGALPIKEVLGILRDIARALAYAHARGVVHRDIKPGNVLLSGGTAVVTDFGIAKALGDARSQVGHSTLTATGSGIGTPAYMAPEQAAGDPDTDHRADIYAFGCVAYEILTGAPPFSGSAVHHVIAAHLRDAAPPVAARRADTPPPLAQLVARCLEKDPVRRPQTAEELLVALDDTFTTTEPNAQAPQRSSRRFAPAGAVLAALAITTAAAYAYSRRASEPLTFAVVPFSNTSHDTALDYRSDGIADEILNGMAAVRGVRVVGRVAAYRYKDRTGQNPPDVEAAGRGLGARVLVTGTLREQNGRITVSTQLNEAATGAELWSASYSRESKDFGSLTDEIVRTVVDTLRARYGGRVGQLHRDRPAAGTTNAAALDLYLLAQQQMKQRGGGVQKSVLNFERAIALDSNFARAYAGLATALQLVPYFMGTPPDEVRDRTIDAARRALKLDSTLAGPHAALGYAYSLSTDWPAFEAEMRRAIALEPDNVDILQTFARVFVLQGRPAEALELLERARKLERLSPVIAAWTSYAFFLTGRVDSALAERARAAQLDSTVLPVTNLGALLDLALGRREAARGLMSAGTPPVMMSNAPYVFAKLGDTATAGRLIRGIESNSPRPWFADAARASVALALGDSSAALAALEQSARTSGPIWYVYMPLQDPAYDLVRGSPRFAALLRRANLNVALLTRPGGGRQH
jgi:serine/threonine-protein kinase